MAKRPRAGKPDKNNKRIDASIGKVAPLGQLYRPVIHLLIIVLIGFVSYSNTFHSPFQWDEMTYLEKNQIIKDLQYFTEPSRAKMFRQYDAFKSRYIGYLTFAINYKCHAFNVMGYHIVNFCIHITNALLVYFFVLLTFKTPYLARFPVSARNSRFIAFFASLLFVSHPVQTEAVTYVFQRLASLVTLFYLFSLVLYIIGRLKSLSAESVTHSAEESSKKSRPYALTPMLFYFLSLVFAVLAMKTKENAFTLPFVVMCYEFLFFSGPIKKRMLRLLPLLLTLFIIPLTFMGIDKPAGEIIGNIGDPASLGYQEISKGSYLVTQFRVIVTYIRLLFLPIKQNIDYDYPLYHSFINPAVIASFLFLLFIFGTALYLLYKTRSEKLKVKSKKATDKGHRAVVRSQNEAVYSPDSVIVGDSPERADPPGAGDSPFTFHGYYRLIGFGIVWFFVTLSIESSIIPIPMLINEYRVYLPSVGAFMAIAAGIFMVVERLRNRMSQIRSVAMPAFFLIILVLSGTTYARNILWMQEITLWEDASKKSPNKARVHNNLGKFYQIHGLFDQALEEYHTALILKPDFPYAHFNRGTVYSELKRYDEALKEYQIALILKPDYPDAHYSSGNAYFNLKRYDEALKEYQTALMLKPDYPDAHYSSGNAYFNLKRYDEALKEYQTALILNPDHAAVHNNSGIVYSELKRYDEALREFQTALKLKPDYAAARRNLEILSREMEREQRKK